MRIYTRQGSIVHMLYSIHNNSSKCILTALITGCTCTVRCVSCTHDPLFLSHRQAARNNGPHGLSADTPHAVHARAARAPLLLNIAACQLREQAYAAATDAATEVVHLASEDSGGGRVDGAAVLLGKAHFRRAAARRALNQTSSAIEDLKEAQRLCVPAPRMC